jgi:hypothetical protein
LLKFVAGAWGEVQRIFTASTYLGKGAESFRKLLKLERITALGVDGLFSLQSSGRAYVCDQMPEINSWLAPSRPFIFGTQPQNLLPAGCPIVTDLVLSQDKGL